MRLATRIDLAIQNSAAVREPARRRQAMPSNPAANNHAAGGAGTVEIQSSGTRASLLSTAPAGTRSDSVAVLRKSV
jgi:hypothetical protein